MSVSFQTSMNGEPAYERWPLHYPAVATYARLIQTHLSDPSTSTRRQTSQKGSKTIEGDLFDAFVKAGAVSADNSDDPTKVFPSSIPNTQSLFKYEIVLIILILLTA